MQAVAAQLAGVVRPQHIVHFMPGPQHHLLISQRRLLLLYLAQLEHATQAPPFENRQAHLRPDGKAACAPTAQVGELHRLQAGAAGQANARVERRLGHADAGRGGVQTRFGATDIGASLRQFGGHAHGETLRAVRHLARCQQALLQAAWLLGDCHAGIGRLDLAAHTAPQVRFPPAKVSTLICTAWPGCTSVNWVSWKLPIT